MGAMLARQAYTKLWESEWPAPQTAPQQSVVEQNPEGGPRGVEWSGVGRGPLLGISSLLVFGMKGSGFWVGLCLAVQPRLLESGEKVSIGSTKNGSPLASVKSIPLQFGQPKLPLGVT